ncbi:hypothetical protein FQZ97_880410 [compost metagenome]
MVQRRHRGPRRELRGRQRVQLHGRGGDDAQRAFAADEEVAQVVAGVVLAQAARAFPDLALRRDHFQAQAQVARVAVAHDLRAARVGRQVAADGAAALGRQAQREQVAGLLGGLLQRLQDAARLDGHREVGGVDVADGVQALQAQHHLRAAVVGNGADRQAGVAALRNDGRAGRGAGFDHVGHLLRIGRAHHGERLAARALAPVLLVGREVALGQHVRGADDGAQLVEEGRRGGHWAEASRGRAAAAAALAWRRRRRTCHAQAAKSTRHSSTSTSARICPTPLVSLQARTTPSVK